MSTSELAHKVFRREFAESLTKSITVTTAASVELKMIIVELDAGKIHHVIHVMQSLYAVTCIHETSSATRSHIAVTYHCGENPCTDHMVYAASKMIEALVEPLRERKQFLKKLMDRVRTSLNETDPIRIVTSAPWIDKDILIDEGPSQMPEPLNFTQRATLVCRFKGSSGPGLFGRSWRWEYSHSRDFHQQKSSPRGKHHTSDLDDDDYIKILPGVTRRINLTAYQDRKVSSALMMSTIWADQLLSNILPETTLQDELFRSSVGRVRRNIAFSAAPLIYDVAQYINDAKRKKLGDDSLHDLPVFSVDMAVSPVMTPDSIIEVDILDNPQLICDTLQSKQT